VDESFMSQQEEAAAEFWREWFSPGGYAREKRLFWLLKHLPSSPRCNFCGAPFHGVGAQVVRLTLGKRRSMVNPRYCSVCDDFARAHPGGAEVDMSILFADVRGSTALSESMSPTEFSKLINRFYVESTRVLIASNALIDKLAGDAVAAFWGAGFAGEDYVLRTIEAGRALLRATGHGGSGEPWVPVGVGVHAGVAFIGAMGSPDGLTDITAVGEEVNLAARLGSKAGVGELLVSTAAMEAAGLSVEGVEPRHLQLKGLAEPVLAYVLHAN
jgi:adenylate cyclase